MKKFVFIFAATVLLTSCASGWSCKKRYCDNNTIEKSTKELTTTKTEVAQP